MTPDLLGIRASLPAPGWTVLDAARDQRFTGELVVTTDTGVEYRVYLDRGDVYVAERAADPSLGVRLVEAGAINAAQLEYGTLRIGTIEHLGRLFDRVPSINRDAVFVLNQLMTEETVRALAGRSVGAVEATPYRHHPSGMHRWSASDPAGTPAPWSDQPEMTLPAPAPDARPVSDVEPAGAPTPEPSAAPPDEATTEPATPAATEPRDAAPPSAEAHDSSHADEIVDQFLDVVEWDEPSLVGASSATTSTERRKLFPSTPHLRTTDWVDQLQGDHLAEAPVEPAVNAKLRPVAVPPADQFEIVWPSGETVDVTAPADRNLDQDADRDVDRGRADLSTRMHTAPLTTPTPATTDEDTHQPTADQPAASAPDDAASDLPSVRADERATPAPDTSVDHDADAVAADQSAVSPDTDDDSDPGSDGSLAVRRAVATIDTGSLAVRRRLASPADDLPAPPGRLIVGRDHHTAWRSGSDRPTGSVFDAQPASFDESNPETPAPVDPHERRSGALKRLIGSLRRG